jgi:hypothetical protein
MAMSERIVLSLDDLDYRAVQNAMHLRNQMAILPDGTSGITGALVAEICRGWMEFMKQRNPPLRAGFESVAVLETST